MMVKSIDTYAKDTPCTYAVQFTVLNNKLNMSVVMRSNDLWYGFCNDQYCFSKLQQLVAERQDMRSVRITISHITYICITIK